MAFDLVSPGKYRIEDGAQLHKTPPAIDKGLYGRDAGVLYLRTEAILRRSPPRKPKALKLPPPSQVKTVDIAVVSVLSSLPTALLVCALIAFGAAAEFARRGAFGHTLALAFVVVCLLGVAIPMQNLARLLRRRRTK